MSSTVLVLTGHSSGGSRWALAQSLERPATWTWSCGWPTVRLAAPGAGMPVIVDLLFASSGIEGEIVRDAERVEIVRGLTLPVARAGHLIALKILARDDRRRPQDYDDLVALLRYADDGEVDRARRSVRLITERGGHRGRALEAALDELLASERPQT